MLTTHPPILPTPTLPTRILLTHILPTLMATIPILATSTRHTLPTAITTATRILSMLSILNM
jgi:hypothetical protein